jgi:hypothetical protein
MHNLARIILFVCVCLLAVSAENRQPSINEFSRLTGCWENNTASKQRDEIWSKPKGGMMLGIGRVVVNGKTTEYEFMRIHQENDGLYFTAQDTQQAQTSFKLMSLRGNVATFENPKHDFPQRIIYDLNTGKALKARIEGTIEGKQQSVDFSFRRAKCDLSNSQEATDVYKN